MSKKKICFIIAVCVISSGWNALHAQEKLIVHPTDGDASVWETALTNIGKMTFSDTGLTIQNTEGVPLKVFMYSGINKLTFGAGGSGIISNSFSPKLTLYPNPATEYIQLIGWDTTKSEEGIAIYSMNGEICYQADKWCGDPIKVSSLPQGTYILKVKNQSFKFRKL